MSDNYDARVLSQIDQYIDHENFHDLPDIFHIWSNEYIRPGFVDVFGVDSSDELYTQCFLDCAQLADVRPTFVSLGCGDGSIEIGIARRLRDNGLHDFDFVCLDISPILIERFRQSIPSDLKSCFTLNATDINKQAIPTKFHAVMAHHSLHHMVGLENIFAAVYAGLHDEGVFVTSDMIGRNGHMRWPEAKLFVDFFWPFLTLRQRSHQLMKRVEQTFTDHDCSMEGFEGIRAQDILPAILHAGLQPQKFLGYGGFIDVFLDRGFGHNFSVADAADIFFIQRLGFLNELLLDTGLVKPTMMTAKFVKYSTEEHCYRGRAAAASIRPTDIDPIWLKDALSDFGKIMLDSSFTYRLRDPAVAHLQFQLEEKEAEVGAMLRSTSWRITAPIRALRRLTSGK